MANKDICKKNVENSTATVTALIPILGYTKASEISEMARKKGVTIKVAAIKSGYISEQAFEECITSEAVCKLGN